MEGRRTRWLTACLVAGAAMIGGCAMTDGSDEGGTIRSENEQLRAQLAREQAAREAAEHQVAIWRAAGHQATPGTSGTGMPGAADATPFANIAGVEVLPEPGQVRLRVPGDSLFASGQAKIKDTAKKTLDQIADVLQAQYKTAAVRVEGYTDTDPIQRSHWLDNLQLSQERAGAVYRYLLDKGVDAGRMYTSAYGESKPLATKDKSRRVEIVVSAQ